MNRHLASSCLSFRMTDSSNLIMKVVPLCQWALTLAGKLLPFSTASIIPAMKADGLSAPKDEKVCCNCQIAASRLTHPTLSNVFQKYCHLAYKHVDHL